jgi:hypothetical protein
MPDPIALANAGAFAVLVATWLVLSVGFFRGDIIPGHVYRREIKRADTATTQAERNAKSIEGILKVIRGKTNAPLG